MNNWTENYLYNLPCTRTAANLCSIHFKCRIFRFASANTVPCHRFRLRGSSIGRFLDTETGNLRASFISQIRIDLSSARADESVQVMRRGRSFRPMNTSLRRSCQLVSALASSYRYLLSIRLLRHDRVGIRFVNIGFAGDTDSVSAILFHRSNGLTEAVSVIGSKRITQIRSSTRSISSYNKNHNVFTACFSLSSPLTTTLQGVPKTTSKG